MRSKITLVFRFFGLIVLILLIAAPLTTGSRSLDREDPAYSAIERAVAQVVANDAARVFGTDSPQHCIANHALAACIHPDTPPERVEEILRSLPTWDDGRFSLGPRWSATATDGPTGYSGNPINLTYSFLDDGVYISGGAGEPGSGSRLYAEMNDQFGSEAVWKALFAGIFNDWGKNIGITYSEVLDDGQSFPGSPGELGLRGDVRIGGHFIDGGYGILAYNYFPDRGDMVLDTNENWNASYNNYVFMRNVCRHEHGHGIGLQHVTPENCTKLMEAYLCTNFDGPQDDDIRGGMRYYGDTMELNNSTGAATDLGLLEGDFGFDYPVSLTSSVDFDYFRFTTAGAAELDVTVDPVGHGYMLDGNFIQTDELMDLAFRVLGGPDGVDVLIVVDDVGLGENEVIIDFELPAAGDYWLVVYRAGGGTALQRYDLSLNVEITDITAVTQGRTPRSELGLSIFPTPFNPRTTARFYVEAPGPVALDVYNVAGQLVRNISGQAASAGWMELTWDGRSDAGGSMPSGTYLLRARVGNRIQTVRGLLLE